MKPSQVLHQSLAVHPLVSKQFPYSQVFVKNQHIEMEKNILLTLVFGYKHW